jgi:SAM-dependent methyltransferase
MHWWTAGMRRIIWTLAGEVTGRVLDVGCGPGWLLREMPTGVWAVGVDWMSRPVEGRPVVEAEAGRLPFADGMFDLILALDLLEQRSVEPAQAMAEAHRVLRCGGRLLARVPAHPWLYGPHDHFWGGSHRYRRAEVAALIGRAGFSILRLTYANSLLFPPAVVVRLLARAGLFGGDDFRPMPAGFNRLLLGFLRLEARWLRQNDLPPGLSLICLAERIA